VGSSAISTPTWFVQGATISITEDVRSTAVDGEREENKDLRPISRADRTEEMSSRSGHIALHGSVTCAQPQNPRLPALPA